MSPPLSPADQAITPAIVGGGGGSIIDGGEGGGGAPASLPYAALGGGGGACDCDCVGEDDVDGVDGVEVGVVVGVVVVGRGVPFLRP